MLYLRFVACFAALLLYRTYVFTNVFLNSCGRLVNGLSGRTAQSIRIDMGHHAHVFGNLKRLACSNLNVNQHLVNVLPWPFPTTHRER